MNWNDKSVLVTGGASFIGSHLVDSLVKRGGKNIRVVDKLSSGKKENIQKHIDSGRVDFVLGNLLNKNDAKISLEDIDIVFSQIISDKADCLAVVGAANRKSVNGNIVSSYNR